MSLTTQISGTALQIACAAFISAMLFPPGDVSKQLAVAATWFLSGAFSMYLWRS